MKFFSGKKAIANVEFIISIAVFLVVISFVTITAFNVLPVFHRETLSEGSKAGLYQFSELVVSEGYPKNWSDDARNTKTYGLSSQERYILDAEKISTLDSLCKTDYEKIRDSFGEYDIKLVVERLNGTVLLDCQQPIKQLSRELYIDRFGVLREPLKPDVNTMLLLHFDNSYDGYSGETPVQQSGTSFTGGRFDEAVLVENNDVLSYSGSEIQQMQGTVEMWVRPEWNGNDDSTTNNYFFDFRPGWYPSPPDFNAIRIGQNGVAHELFAFKIADKNNVSYAINASINNWNAGQWHYIAATWKNVNSGYPNAEMHFYIDGKEVGNPVTNSLITLNETPNSIYIGSVRGVMNFANAAIDEVRISNISRSEEEIFKNYFGDIVRIRTTVIG